MMTDLFQLTRALIDIESITKNELAVGEFLLSHLSALGWRYQGRVERMDVEPGRFNVFAHWGDPLVTLSTHMDTVPPHVPSREDEERIWGRGACDAKGIIASMIHAATALLDDGVRNFGLLFVVGEEKNSAGAKTAARNPRGSRYLINGEPSENKLALGSKGALRYEISAAGKMAHSAYPELGDSAIDKLLDVLEELRRIPLPSHPTLGRSTLNIGAIAGGRAPNVVPDAACAEVMFRLVDDPAPLREAVARAAAGRAIAREVLCIPAVQLGTLEGIETTVVAYTSDIPEFGGAWGQPYMLGPGSIHVAHTPDEYVEKRQLTGAVRIYQTMVRQLLTAQGREQHATQN
jgi:acetylornithine deacetylase